MEKDSIENKIQCQICLDGVQDRVLNCGHSLCGSCLFKNPTNQCVFCRTKITSVAKNFVIMGLAESLALGGKICTDALPQRFWADDDSSDEESSDDDLPVPEDLSIVYGEENRLKLWVESHDTLVLENTFDYIFPSTILNVKCSEHKIFCCCKNAVFLFEQNRLFLKLLLTVDVTDYLVYGMLTKHCFVVVDGNKWATVYSEDRQSKEYGLSFKTQFMEGVLTEPFECGGWIVFVFERKFFLWSPSGSKYVDNLVHGGLGVNISVCTMTSNCFYLLLHYTIYEYEFEGGDGNALVLRSHDISRHRWRNPTKIFSICDGYFGLSCYKHNLESVYVFKKMGRGCRLTFKNGVDGDQGPIRLFSPLDVSATQTVNNIRTNMGKTTVFAYEHGTTCSFGKWVNLK